MRKPSNKKTVAVKENRNAEVGKLKRHINKLDKEIDRLKAELRTYKTEFSEIKFIKESPKKETNLDKVSKKEQNTNKFKDLQDKWECFKCHEGVMKLIVITRPDKSVYFRCCSNKTCGNRTPLKDYHEKVEGIK